MADAMVTGRVPLQKKVAATRVLNQIGVSTSQAINQLFDYLIQHGSLPFPQEERSQATAADMTEAREFICSMVRPNAFSGMTDEQIKCHKAASMGYMSDEL